MKMLTFSVRNAKEILRDPLNLAFGLGFPVIVLLLLSVIQANIPVDMFQIARLAPGIAVFGMSFMTLFSATLIAKDRSSALLQRLYTTPLSPKDFILGYILPVLPICAVQMLICYAVAAVLGLELSVNILLSVVFALPVALFFIAVGLLCGSVFNDKQVGGICGALFTNLSAWLSGIWFDVELLGGTFKKIANALPFIHAVEMERAVLSGNYAGVFPHFCWVAGYAAAVIIAAVFAFFHQMKKQ
ncbi:MAG: ABC transporter permease [Oscillospiraceae bacterium]|nr:ABC transporter permease [Oscillospiraceae bacterium]